MQASMGMSGSLAAVRVSGMRKAPLSWKLRNTLRWAFLWGWLVTHLARLFSRLTGIHTLISELQAIHIDGLTGLRTDYGTISYRMVTDTGVGYLVDYWQAGTPDLQAMKYVGCGTGAGAEAVGNTALSTECTTALNPDNTRATGTLTQPTAPVVRNVGTLTFDADAAVTEHGIFSQAATGGGVLWDKSLFTAINVVGANGDSIQFTYNLTVTSGG